MSNGMPFLPNAMRHQFDHHVAEPEGQQQRIVDAAAVQRPDQHPLDDEPEQADDQRHRDQANPEIATEHQDVDPDIGADHVERAMGEIHDSQHAEDQRQPDREQHVDRAERQPGE